MGVREFMLTLCRDLHEHTHLSQRNIVGICGSKRPCVNETASHLCILDGVNLLREYCLQIIQATFDHSSAVSARMRSHGCHAFMKPRTSILETSMLPSFCCA